MKATRTLLVVLMMACHKGASVSVTSHDAAAIASDVPSPPPTPPPPLAAIACAPELGSVGTLPVSRLPTAQRTWHPGAAKAVPLLVELARTRAATSFWKAGAAAVVLRTADDKRCDRFIEAQSSVAGPFFGFAGSTGAWSAKAYVGAEDFANLVLAIVDDHDDIRALYEHEHNVNMDAGYALGRLDVGGAFIPLVTSYSGGDGQSAAFAELFGATASGEPKSLLLLYGSGPMPHAIASVTVGIGGAVPELEGVTSKAPASCLLRDCLVCSKAQYVWSAATSTFRRTGAAAPAKCPP